MKEKLDTYAPQRMSSAAQRLQFVVRFAEMDLETLRPGDRLNLRDDIAVFLRSPWHVLTWGRDRLQMQRGPVLIFPTEADYPDETLRVLQHDVRTILHGMVLANREDIADSSVVVPLSVELAIDNWGDTEQEQHPALVAAGGTRDVFLLLTFMLLREVGTHHIVRCPECERLFYRWKSQRYCSRACVNRVSQRRWRERQEAASPVS